jgi:hypothetical protein
MSPGLKAGTGRFGEPKNGAFTANGLRATARQRLLVKLYVSAMHWVDPAQVAAPIGDGIESAQADHGRRSPPLVTPRSTRLGELAHSAGRKSRYRNRARDRPAGTLLATVR